jgi:hypothetical protein
MTADGGHERRHVELFRQGGIKSDALTRMQVEVACGMPGDASGCGRAQIRGYRSALDP